MIMLPKVWRTWWAMSVGFLVVQVVWSIQYVFMLSLLLQHGMSNLLASYAWLPSPILQIILSPLFGKWSDRLNEQSRFGRRLPFIIAFTVLGTAFLIIIPLASTFGCVVSSKVSCNSSGHDDEEDDDSIPPQYVVLSILTVSFIGMDFCMSCNEEFQRGIATDMCSSEQVTPSESSSQDLEEDEDTAADTPPKSEGQIDDTRPLVSTPLVNNDTQSQSDTDAMSGHSVLAFSSAAGNAIGFLLSAIDWSSISKATGIVNGDVLFLVILALLLFVPGMYMLVWKVQKTRRAENIVYERQTEALSSEQQMTTKETLSTQQHSSTATSERKLPCKFYILCGQQIVAWIPIWSLWQYASAYFGTVVKGGSPRASTGSDLGNKYAAGLHLGALSAGLVAVVAIVSSVALPRILKSWGLKRTYIISQLAGAIALLIAHLTHEMTASTVIFISFLGISWAANNSIPFTVVDDFNDIRDEQDDKPESQKNTAFATNVLYLSQTIPQLIAAVVLGPIISKLAEGGSINDYKDAYATPILLGIVCQFVSAPLALLWFPRKRSMESAYGG